MRESDNILDLLREKGDEAAKRALRGVILQPGAIGDCVLTLPLAEFMKDCLGLGGIDIIGHTDYIGILPGRTCVDSVRSIDSIDLSRLFVIPDKFDLEDKDALISVFGDYAWIVTFLGEPDSNFEQNLIFTANCSRSAEVISMSMKPSGDFSSHITDFFIRQFITHSGLPLEYSTFYKTKRLIKAARADVNKGKELLKESEDFGVVPEENIDFCEGLVVIQPGSGGLYKCCHLGNFLAVAEELVSKDFKVIFLLGPVELEQFSDAAIEKITSVAECLTDLSLTQVLELLSCTDTFLGNDSGITHLAAARGVKTIAVFGPTNPELYGPIGPAVKVVVSGDEDFAKKPSYSLQEELLDTLNV